MAYRLIDTPSGAKSLVFNDGRDVRIHSAFDPVKEAERAASSFNPGKKNIIAVTGLGLGYHVRALSEKFPDKKIIVIEKDSAVIDIVHAHCAESIAHALIVRTYDDLSILFEDMDISSFRGFAVFTHRPSYSLAPGFYDDLLTDMNRYVSSKISDLLTRFEFEERWAENIIANIPTLFRSSTVHNLFGAFRGYPGIIVSAGPSLKKNVHLLRELKDKALICCVDTSFKVLSRMGISPHIVMTLDAQKHSIRHFLGIPNSDPYLIADMVSYPKIAERYKGTVLFSTTSKYYNDDTGNIKRETTPLMDWVEQFTPNIGDIQSGGSVATSLFDFMLNAGCNPIILIGQDLAYTGREIHTSGTYHNDEWLTHTNRTYNLDTINQKVVRKRKIKYVPAWGNNGSVITDYVMDLYRQWFEDSFTKVPLRIINATEGGARIAGTDELPLETVVQSLKKQTRTPEAILHSKVTGTSFVAQTFIAGLEKTLPIISSLSALDPENYTDIKKALARISDKNLDLLLAPYLKKINAYLNRNQDIDSDRADAMIAKDVVRASIILKELLEACLSRLKAVQ